MTRTPLPVLADLESASGLTYDPQTMIEAVNDLASVGKGAALGALRASPASADARLIVARVTFVCTQTALPLPSLKLGRTDLDDAEALGNFPLFPIALQSDIPFLMVTGYYRGGEIDPSPYLDFCDRHCTIREALRPDPDPLAAARALCSSDAWTELSAPPSYTEMVQAQAERVAAGRRHGDTSG